MEVVVDHCPESWLLELQDPMLALADAVVVAAGQGREGEGYCV